MTRTDALAAAGESYQRAREAVAQYRLPDARAHLEQARRSLAGQDPEESFELSLRIGLTETWLVCDDEGLPAALEMLRDAEARASAAGRDDLRALSHIQAGVLCARAGQMDEALEQLRPAAALASALPLEDRVRLLLNKGAIGSQAGHLDEAASDLQEAARLAADIPDHAFMALHNLGFVEYLRGDLPAALRTMLAADELDAPVDRSVSRLDRARVLMEVGLIDDAAELLATTVADLRAAGMVEELMEASLDAARCAALRGRLPEAARTATQMAAEAAARSESHRALAAEAIRLEALVLDPRADREGLAQEAEALARTMREEGLQALADRVTVLALVAREPDGAGAADPDAAEAIRRMLASPLLAVRLLAVRAMLGLEEDAHERRRLVRRARADLAAAKAGMASLDLRTALTVHVAPIIVSDLVSAVQRGRAWEVLLATERWRTVLASVPSVNRPLDEAVANLWSTLRQRHEDLRAAGAEASETLRTEAARLERRLRHRTWTAPGAASDPDRGRLVRSALADTVTLSYFWLDRRLHVVAVEPGRAARMHQLGGASEIGELVSRAVADATALAHAQHGPLTAGILGSLEGSLAHLDELVLPPDLADGPAVVVPSGALARLPWGMLPRMRGRSVALTQSLTGWSGGRSVVGRTPSVAVASGPGLGTGEQEAAAAARAWPGAVRLEGRAGDVAEALCTHDVVHIAAHGRHRPDNPLFSSLLLHGGPLFAHELERLKLRSTLVVLSACGVGRARVRPGDEALGLTASLLALGVRAVVAPLTDVPDDLACATMAEFHARLAAGQDGPAALAEASGGLLARSFSWFGSPWKLGSTQRV